MARRRAQRSQHARRRQSRYHLRSSGSAPEIPIEGDGKSPDNQTDTDSQASQSGRVDGGNFHEEQDDDKTQNFTSGIGTSALPNGVAPDDQPGLTFSTETLSATARPSTGFILGVPASLQQAVSFNGGEHPSVTAEFTSAPVEQSRTRAFAPAPALFELQPLLPPEYNLFHSRPAQVPGSSAYGPQPGVPPWADQGSVAMSDGPQSDVSRPARDWEVLTYTTQPNASSSQSALGLSPSQFQTMAQQAQSQSMTEPSYHQSDVQPCHSPRNYLTYSYEVNPYLDSGLNAQPSGPSSFHNSMVGSQNGQGGSSSALATDNMGNSSRDDNAAGLQGPAKTERFGGRLAYKTSRKWLTRAIARRLLEADLAVHELAEAVEVAQAVDAEWQAEGVPAVERFSNWLTEARERNPLLDMAVSIEHQRSKEQEADTPFNRAQALIFTERDADSSGQLDGAQPNEKMPYCKLCSKRKWVAHYKNCTNPCDGQAPCQNCAAVGNPQECIYGRRTKATREHYQHQRETRGLAALGNLPTRVNYAPPRGQRSKWCKRCSKSRYACDGAEPCSRCQNAGKTCEYGGLRPRGPRPRHPPPVPVEQAAEEDHCKDATVINDDKGDAADMEMEDGEETES